MNNQQIQRVHCNKCKDYKLLIEPWYIVKKNGKYGDIISFKGICPECKTSQSRKLPSELIRAEVRETFKTYPYGEYKIDSTGNIQNKDGRILPFLIPLFIGLGTAAAVSGAVAGPVLAKQKNDQDAKAQELALEEQKRSNKELENITKKNEEEKTKAYKEALASPVENKEGGLLGSAVTNKVKETLLELKDTILKDLVKAILKDEIENSVELLPKLMKHPDVINYIKEKVLETKAEQNIQGSGISGQLTEQEQIEEAIEFLEGKGFKFL